MSKIEEQRKTDAERLVDAALRHVPFDGMNNRALTAAAHDLGFEAAYARLLVPGGAAGLATAYHRRQDDALRQSLAENPPQGRVRDRVTESVMRRLALSDPELVRAGAAVMALPGNAALGLRLLGETAGVIWDALGDASDDLAWWTKRASLGAVIGATVLYWLGDQSPDHADSRAFLERRIDGMMRVEAAKARLRKLPGWDRVAQATTGWVHAPEGAVMPATEDRGA